MALSKQAFLVLALVIAMAQALSAARAGAFAGGYAGNGGFPQLPGFGQFNLPGFGNFHIPTPDEIAESVANANPGPNNKYFGIAAKSNSNGESTILTNDNGVVRQYQSNAQPGRNGGFTGVAATSNGQGSTILTTDNGAVRAFQVGNNGQPEELTPKQEEIKQEIPEKKRKSKKYGKVDPFEYDFFDNDPFFKPTKKKPFKFEPIHFEPITFRPIVFEPIVFEPIKPIDPDEIRNYKPGDHEHHVSHYSSSHIETSNNNGVKKSKGKVETIVNIDGQVTEDSVTFDSDSDKQRKSKVLMRGPDV